MFFNPITKKLDHFIKDKKLPFEKATIFSQAQYREDMIVLHKNKISVINGFGQIVEFSIEIPYS